MREEYRSRNDTTPFLGTCEVHYVTRGKLIRPRYEVWQFLFLRAVGHAMWYLVGVRHSSDAAANFAKERESAALSRAFVQEVVTQQPLNLDAHLV